MRNAATPREEVEDALIDLLAAADPESFTRVMWYFDNREDDAAPVIRFLHKLVSRGNNEAFERYVRKLVEDTQTAEANPEYYRAMKLMYEQLLEENEDPFHPELEGKALTPSSFRPLGAGTTSLYFALARMSPVNKTSVLAAVSDIVKNRSSMVVFDEMFSFVARNGKMISAGLVAAQLTYEAIVNIYKWWNGEISGKRCAKNVVDSFLTIGCGIGGGYCGVMIGSVLGPVGSVAGGLAGSIIASMVAEVYADMLTQRLFHLPKTVALENAYKFFGVEHDAPNSEINRAYHRRCRETHPDRNGGSHGQFLEVQVHLQLIRSARGEPTVRLPHELVAIATAVCMQAANMVAEANESAQLLES